MLEVFQRGAAPPPPSGAPAPSVSSALAAPAPNAQGPQTRTVYWIAYPCVGKTVVRIGRRIGSEVRINHPSTSRDLAEIAMVINELPGTNLSMEEPCMGLVWSQKSKYSSTLIEQRRPIPPGTVFMLQPARSTIYVSPAVSIAIAWRPRRICITSADERFRAELQCKVFSAHGVFVRPCPPRSRPPRAADRALVFAQGSIS